MKKSSIAVAMMLAMGVTAAQAAETGTLNFSGNVTTTACSIDAASLNTAVNFGTLAKDNILSLPAVGDTNAQLTKPFTIKLADCPVDTPISVKFEGGSYYDAGIQGFRDNKTLRQANVAAMIFDAETSAKVTPNEFVSKGVATAGVNDLRYNISLTKWWTGGNTTADGDFSMAINYTMSYQ